MTPKLPDIYLRISRIRSIGTFLAIGFALMIPASAQITYNLDLNGNTAGVGSNADFSWGGSKDWTTGGNPVAWPTASPGNNAVFGAAGAGSFTVTTSSDITVGMITVNTG